MRFNIKYKYRFMPLLLVLMLLSACAGTAPKESSIEERATARWNAVLAGDLAGAYEFLSPGFRSSVSFIQYQRSILLKPVKWTSAKYVGNTCTETLCDVRVLVGYRVAGALPGVKTYDGKQEIQESWILTGGLWYLVPDA